VQLKGVEPCHGDGGADAKYRNRNAKDHAEQTDPPMPPHVVCSHQCGLQNEKCQPSRKDCRMKIKQRRSGHERVNQILFDREAEAVHNDHGDQQGHEEIEILVQYACSVGRDCDSPQ